MVKIKMWGYMDQVYLGNWKDLKNVWKTNSLYYSGAKEVIRSDKEIIASSNLQKILYMALQ